MQGRYRIGIRSIMTGHTGFLTAALIAGSAVTAGAQSPGTDPASASAAARPPVEISSNDVFFTSRWFKASPSKTFSAMCGYAIHGNFLSRDLPRPEWANGYLHQCLERLHPLPPGAASYYKINSPLELMSQDPFGAR